MIYIGLILGLFFLFFGGDILVSGAVSLARRMGVSSLLIGLTLVGFGTSAPELVTSLIAASRGSGGIAAGNVIGSNIANILLVLGVACFIRPVPVPIKGFRRDAAFLILSTIAVVAAVMLGKMTMLLGCVLVATLIYYVVYTYRSDKRHQRKNNIHQDEKEIAAVQKISIPMSLGKTVLGIIITLLGAKLLVDCAVVLAMEWGVPETVIGLSVVAIGTSLPELATSIMSAYRGHSEVAFGNVVGSNIYNALFILGMTAIITPVVVPASLTIDVVFMAAVTVTMVGVAFWKHNFSRRTGFMFLMMYAAYISYLAMGYGG